MVAMGRRITEVVLGPNFSAQVADEAEAVMMHATAKNVKFKPKFGVMHIGEFAKILASFGEEVDIELTDGKLVMKSGGVTVWYQTSDVDKIGSTLTSFKEADKVISSSVVVTAEPEEGFLASFTKYQKLIGPDLVEIALKGKKLVMRLISMKGHKAEVVVGTAEVAKKKKFVGFKVSADVLTDVLSGVKPNEEDQLKFAVGKALRIEFRTYKFLVSPQVELTE
jgi:hypothetical protein